MLDFLLRLCIEKFIEKYVIEFLFDLCFQYLKDRFRWPTALKEMYGRLSEKLPMIQAESRAIEPIRNTEETKLDICGVFLETDCNTPPKEWLWQLRDYIDEAGDALDKYEYVVSNEERLIRDKEKTKKRKVMSSLFEGASEIAKTFKGSILKMESFVKRLQKLVRKIDQVIGDEITTFNKYLYKIDLVTAYDTTFLQLMRSIID